MKAKNISEENFRSYGKVVKTPSGEPTSQNIDYKFWSDIASYSIKGETEVGICTVFKQAKNEISGIERHLQTPEILIPIDAPFVLPLYKNESEMDAFKVELGEAVIINPSVWHGACLPVGKESSSYFVIFRKRTPFEDVEKKSIEPIEIENI